MVTLSAPQPQNPETDSQEPPLTLGNLPHRVRDIATLRGLGYSFREIADQFHVTPQAVALMLSRHKRTLQSLGGSGELANLSSRAVNALGRHGITTRGEARARDVLSLLRHERNCGRKTLDEIERWMSESNSTGPS